jgi:hypothetical protein
VAPVLLLSVAALFGHAVRFVEIAHVQDFLQTRDREEFFTHFRTWRDLPKADPKRVRLLTLLLPALRKKEEVPLPSDGSFEVQYRVKIGQMKAIGLGASYSQDLYLTGGRAAKAISILLGDDDLPDLDGGLDKAEWTKRADAIEAKVKAFVAKAAKDAPKKK